MSTTELAPGPETPAPAPQPLSRRQRQAARKAVKAQRAEVIPDMVDVAEVAAGLPPSASGRARSTHSLVRASSKGQFVRVTRIGNKWYARRAEVVAWFEVNHATGVSEALLARVRKAGRAARRPADPAQQPPTDPQSAGTSASS